MRLSSAQERKRLLQDAALKDPISDEVAAYYASTDTPPLPGTAIGIERQGPKVDDWAVSLIAYDRAAAAKIKEGSPKETVVRIVEVDARPSASFFRRWTGKAVSGKGVAPAGAHHYGSYSYAIPSIEDPEILLLLTNWHVLIGIEKYQIGHTVMNGTKAVGVTYASPGVSFLAPNKVDAASVRTRPDIQVETRYSYAARSDLVKLRRTLARDVGADIGNSGATIGTNRGKCLGFAYDGLRVRYGDGARVGIFNDVGLGSGGVAVDLSAPGHSGSGIDRLDEKAGIGLLFAGGKDVDTGEDLTMWNGDLPLACRLVGGEARLFGSAA